MPMPPHEPSDKIRAEVTALKSFGIPVAEIAKYVGIDEKTLRKYYREELDVAEPKANAQVGRFLYHAASGKALDEGASYSDCVRAAMFWAKTRMQWRETNHHDITNSDGSMAPVERVAIQVIDGTEDKGD